MAQADKLIAAFRACRGEFAYTDFIKMITSLGYEPVKTGRTGGSRRRYAHKVKKHILLFHKPHGPNFGAGTVDNLRNDLMGVGML